jgi:hypothetical protein
MPSQHCDGGCDGCGGGIACLRDEVERLRKAAIELLLHPRSAKAALGMYDALGLNPFSIRDAAAKTGKE